MDQGAIVENKRLSHALQVLRERCRRVGKLAYRGLLLRPSFS